MAIELTGVSAAAKLSNTFEAKRELSMPLAGLQHWNCREILSFTSHAKFFGHLKRPVDPISPMDELGSPQCLRLI